MQVVVLPEMPQVHPGPLTVAGESPVGRLSVTVTMPLVRDATGVGHGQRVAGADLSLRETAVWRSW